MNKKIIIRIKGGLGNQLFQLNLGELISSELGIIVKYDIKTGYINDVFNREVCFFSIYKNNEHLVYKGFFNKLLYLRLLKIVSLRFKLRFFKWIYLDENRNVDTSDLFAVIKSSGSKIILEGYWQKIDFISDNFLKILNKNLKKPMIKYSVNDLVVHYRSDNFSDSFSYEYFDKAIKLMLTKYTNINQIIVYSDSVRVLKLIEYLNLRNLITLKHDYSDYDPFTLLSTLVTSKYFIPSNGTFSFWALLLGRERIILLPPALKLSSFYKFENLYIKSDK